MSKIAIELILSEFTQIMELIRSTNQLNKHEYKALAIASLSQE